MRAMFLLFCCLCPTLLAGESPYIAVLGVAQDAGFPQAGCAKKCCAAIAEGKAKPRMATCLALVEPTSGKRWLFEATPNFTAQLNRLGQLPPAQLGALPEGIFLSHGHMGHYTGLMFLGREVMGTHELPVYAMPRMYQFLSNNGPWDQLVRLKNISLIAARADAEIVLTSKLAVTPFLVPHRDEYTETVGFVIRGPKHKVAFIPDIDKWERWDRRIEDLIASVDVAYLDATFFAEGEIPGRNMSQIPHPFVAESLARFSSLPASERKKVHFIHFNHTNPILVPGSEAYQSVIAAGMHVAAEGETVEL